MQAKYSADDLQDGNDSGILVVMRGKPMKDYVFVNEEGFQSKKDFDHWIKLSLDFNPQAKASKKKK